MWTYHRGLNPSSSNMDIQRGNLLIYGFFASNILDQGIPVEYELDTFNMPSTSTTEIYYVDSSATPLSTSSLRSRQVPFSPLVHCNGDNARLSPKHQTHEATRWPWILPSHIQRHAAISNIPLSYRVSKTNKPKDHEFCSAKNKPPQSCK